MAENVVDALLVTFGIDNSEYVRGVDEAVEKTREFSEKAPREAEHGLKSIEQKFGATFQGIFRSFIAPLTAALGATGLFSQYTAAADRIGKTAKRIGMDAQELQAWGEAAKRAGGSTEGFMHSVESLNFRLSRMQLMGGKGPLAKLFGDLHISATENGRLKDTFQILRELAGAMDKMDEAGKVELGKKLKIAGIDPGTIALLQMGRISMDDLIKRQRDLGVYTEEDFKITAKFNDALSDLQQVFKALAAVILRVVVPPITAITEAMAVVIKTFREHQGFIVAGLLVISGVLSGVLLKAVTALGTALAPLLAPLLAPIAAIAALGLIFDEIAVYAEGGQTALEGLWKAIGTPEDFRAVGKAVKDFAQDAWDTLGKLAKQLFDVLSPLADVFAPLLEAVGSVATAMLQLIFPVDDLFSPGEPGSGWSALKQIVGVIADALSFVLGIVKDVFDWIGDMTARAREALKSFEFVKTVRGWIDDLFSAIRGLFSPGQPGSEWNALRAIIDGMKAAIDFALDSVKRLLEWVNKLLTGIRAWWNSGEIGVADAKKEIAGDKGEAEYIKERAAAIKKASPKLTDEQATATAKKELESDAKLKSDYDVLRSYDKGLRDTTLQEMGYSQQQIDDFEERYINNAPAKPVQSASQVQVVEPAAKSVAAPAPAAKPEVKPAPAPVAKPTPKTTPASKPAVKPAPAVQAAPAPKTAAKPATKPAPAQAAKPTAKPAAPKVAQKGGDGLAGTVKSILDVLLTISANVGSLGAVAAKIPDMGNVTQTYNTRNEQNNRYETRIETINVNAPAATNAEGIARELPAAIRNRTPNLASANAGVFGS